jgi:hypothetical protein
LIGILRGQGMYTDYIGTEPRCCVIAKKLIWCVAAICCTGGEADATSAGDARAGDDGAVHVEGAGRAEDRAQADSRE